MTKVESGVSSRKQIDSSWARQLPANCMTAPHALPRRPPDAHPLLLRGSLPARTTMKDVLDLMHADLRARRAGSHSLRTSHSNESRNRRARRALDKYLRQHKQRANPAFIVPNIATNLHRSMRCIDRRHPHLAFSACCAAKPRTFIPLKIQVVHFVYSPSITSRIQLPCQPSSPARRPSRSRMPPGPCHLRQSLHSWRCSSLCW